LTDRIVIMNNAPTACLVTDYAQNYFFYNAPGTPAEISWRLGNTGEYKFPLGFREGGAFYGMPTSLDFIAPAGYDSIFVSFYRTAPGTFSTPNPECYFPSAPGYTGVLYGGFWRYLPQGASGAFMYNMTNWMADGTYSGFTPITDVNSWTIVKRPTATPPWNLQGLPDCSCDFLMPSPLTLKACRLQLTSFSDAAIAFNENSPFPEDKLNLKATVKGNKYIELDWTAKPLASVMSFDLYRSDNGGQPVKIYSKAPDPDQASLPQQHGFDDHNVIPDVVYTYHVRQTDANGGSSNSNTVEARLFAEEGLSLDLYPNPTRGVVYLTYRSTFTDKMNVRIYDMLGKLVSEDAFDVNPGSETLTFDLSNVSSAAYTFSVTAGGKVEVFKVVKND